MRLSMICIHFFTYSLLVESKLILQFFAAQAHPRQPCLLPGALALEHRRAAAILFFRSGISQLYARARARARDLAFRSPGSRARCTRRFRYLRRSRRRERRRRRRCCPVVCGGSLPEAICCRPARADGTTAFRVRRGRVCVRVVVLAGRRRRRRRDAAVHVPFPRRQAHAEPGRRGR